MAKKGKGAAARNRRLILFLAGALAAAVLILVLVLVIRSPAETEEENKPEVVTVSTLEKIINVSSLSSFTAVYNGIAEKRVEDKPEETAYYVSYNARVEAGIELDLIDIDVDNEQKTVRVVLPDVEITDINVDIGSLDFIFYQDDENASSVTQEAYRLCEEDVREESGKQEAIFELARQNAVNIVTALVSPIIEQLDAGYTLTVE